MEENKLKKIFLAVVLLIFIITIGVVVYYNFFYEENGQITDIVEEENNGYFIDNDGLMEPFAKPIIYIYPEEETKLLVTLGNPQRISCSYPEYKDGWNVTAYPDGTLVDNNTNRELYSLYWEGADFNASVTEEGFIVKREDTIKFLEEKLDILGLSNKEAEEFIIYWLPKLQESEYNYIRFTSKEEIDEYMPLEFSKEPDTLIRVHMQFKNLDEPIEVREQNLQKQQRNGFTVVEWGGTEII